MQWSPTQMLTLSALFKLISFPYLPPFYTVSQFVLLIICLMVSFIFCHPKRAVVKNHMHNYSCLLQQDNSLQFWFFSKYYSVILPYNMCSAQTQTVPFPQNTSI